MNPLDLSLARKRTDAIERALDADRLLRAAEPISNITQNGGAAPESQLDMPPSDAKRYSIGAIIRALFEGKGTWASYRGVEKEAHDVLAARYGNPASSGRVYIPRDISHRDSSHRALTVASGNTLVDTENLGFIPLLRNRALAYRLGAKPVIDLRGNMNRPTQSGAAMAYWLNAESQQVSEVEQTLGAVALSPHTVGAYTEISHLLLKQSDPAIEGLVTNDLANVGAVAVDMGFFNGNGRGGQVLGAANLVAATSVGGASFARSTQNAMQKALLDANANMMSPAFVASPAVAQLLSNRQRFTGSNSAIWEGPLRDGAVAGIRAAASNNIPANTLMLIDFSEAIIAEWGALEIEVNPFVNFLAGIIGVRMLWTIDVAFQHPATVAIATSVS